MMHDKCDVPCGLCGVDECKRRIEKQCNLTYAEAQKIVNESVRSDFNFRMAVLNALVDYRKGGKKNDTF